VRIIFPYNAKVLSGYQFHPSFEQATKYSGRQVRIWLAGPSNPHARQARRPGTAWDGFGSWAIACLRMSLDLQRSLQLVL